MSNRVHINFARQIVTVRDSETGQTFQTLVDNDIMLSIIPVTSFEDVLALFIVLLPVTYRFMTDHEIFRLARVTRHLLTEFHFINQRRVDIPMRDSLVCYALRICRVLLEGISPDIPRYYPSLESLQWITLGADLAFPTEDEMRQMETEFLPLSINYHNEWLFLPLNYQNGRLRYHEDLVIAVVMALHPRLGRESLLFNIDDFLVFDIILMSLDINPRMTVTLRAPPSFEELLEDFSLWYAS